MWSLDQVAERDGVSKQAVSKKVKRLVDAGLVVERDERGRVAKFNVVQYDLLRGRLDDPAQKRAPKTAAEPAKPAADSYDEARRTQAWLAAERERLALDEMKGRLVPVDQVRDAFATVGGIIAAVIDRLPNAADDIAAEVAKSGGHGARVALANEAARLRTEIADALHNARVDKGGVPAQPTG